MTTVRVQRKGKRWLVSGGGPTLEFASNQAATNEFNQRIRGSRARRRDPATDALKTQWGVPGIEFGTPVPFGRRDREEADQ